MSEQAANDRELARRMLAGDEDAFQAFFDAYFPRLYRFALSRAGDEAAAEELVQTTLCRAMDKLHTYRGEAALFTWLCTFCRHEIWAWQKRERRERVELAEDEPEVRAALESLSSWAGEGPEELARRGELGRIVQVVLDHLPPRYGDALEWKYVDELSVREISERLGLGLKATESLLVRARRAFRDGYTSLVEAG